jgi:uncharacterized membrane protein
MRLLHDPKKLAILFFAVFTIVLFFVFDLKRYMTPDALQATGESLERLSTHHIALPR